VNITTRTVCTTAGASIIASMALSTALISSASADGMDGHVMTGPTGNKVEMVDPAHSTYIPNIAAATARDRTKAQTLLNGTNTFCATRSLATIKANWRPGTSTPNNTTHYFNPSKKASGLNPSNPRAALVYDGKLGGLMFGGVPLPSLGSIPRAHGHDMVNPVEMVHVYCTNNLKDAYTPNRLLGVKADLTTLRLKIRPAITDLNKTQLQAVLTKVRAPRTTTNNTTTTATTNNTATNKGPDPVLEAMRMEIRASLMILSETRLRNIWTLIKSFR
jgi:hypothetical protein